MEKVLEERLLDACETPSVAAILGPYVSHIKGFGGALYSPFE
jgi:hypothetical protein